MPILEVLLNSCGASGVDGFTLHFPVALKKMPLGKLNKQQLVKGFNIVEKLEEHLPGH